MPRFTTLGLFFSKIQHHRVSNSETFWQEADAPDRSADKAWFLAPSIFAFK